MGRMRALRLVLALVIAFPVLRAAPAYSWHGSGSVTALAVAPSNPSIIYARTSDRGVFKSTDGGASWNATGGLKDVFVWTLAVDPSNPDTLFAGTHSNGVLKSTDGGASWSPSLTNENCFGYCGIVQTLAIDPQKPDTLYAGAIYAFKSTDGGATWSWSGLSDGVQALAIDPLTPSTVYAGTDINHEGSDPEMIRGGVFKSTDGGASWSTTGLTNIPVSALAIAPSNSTLSQRVAVRFYGGVFKSTDGGASWNWSAAGLTNVLFGSLVFDPQHENTVYAASESGVFKSTDGGATWSAFNGGLTDFLTAYGVGPSVGPLAIDPLTPTTLYAGTSIGVFKSTDGAAYWSPTGLTQHSPLHSLSLNPTSVTAGTVSTGTVTLIAPAPVGGAVVTVFSSDPTVGTVPASVTVPAGAWVAYFSVSTNSVTAFTSVTISGSYGGVTKSANLTVNPAITLSALSLNPTSVNSQTASTGTVTLSAAAPMGGAVVTLSSSDTTVATVPASVTVAAGVTSANFTVSTSVVPASATVTISGAYGGVTRSAVLTVLPASTTLASVSLNPTSVTGGSPSSGTVTLIAEAPAGGAVGPPPRRHPAAAA